MVPRMRPSRLALVAVAALLLGGCLGRGYGDVLEVHLEVLLAMSDKLCSMAQAGDAPPTEEMPEFVYPSRRAHQFGRYFATDSKRSSYPLLQQLLDQYDDMVRVADEARQRAGDWRASAGAVCADRDRIRGLAEQIRGSLRHGD